MRASSVVVIACLLFPVVLSAQAMPPTGPRRRGPLGPAPLPPQPGSIATQLAYKRSHLTIETYPLLSRVDAPDFMPDGSVSAWTTFGTGTRADYRLTRYLSATLDVTSSFLGGPASVETAELGTRFHPLRSDRRVYPFADVRIGYISSYTRNPGSLLDAVSGYGAGASGSRYSQGFGGVAGVGIEYALSRSFSLTTGGSVLRNRMTARGLQPIQAERRSYDMTWYRYTLGVSYNPVRVIRPQGGDAR